MRIFLKDIDCLAALKAVCHGHGLWYREDPESGIIYILTLDEFTKGDAFSEKKFVEVVTLAYPRCEDIAAAIQDAYRDMLVYMAPDQDDDDEIGDISRALERMDELANRSTIIDGDGSSSRKSSSSGRGRSSGRRNSQSQRGMENVRRYYDDIERIDKRNSQIEFMPREPSSEGSEADGAPRTLRPSMVFASIVRRSNSIVLRSSDREMLNQIKETIRQLDIPRAQVLLEVRVLQLDVTDAKDRELGFLLNDSSHSYGSFDGGFSKNMSVRDMMYTVTGSRDGSGDIKYNVGKDTIATELSGLDIAESALYPNHSIFQLLNKHYSLRLNMLDSRGKVRALATPSLMVADYEASRIFLGTTRYVQTGFTAGTALVGDGIGSQSATTSNFEERNIGTALVITPKVHTDGTVTLRIMQENSTALDERAVNTSSGTFYETPIKRETITSSIVAKDGETIALGGLMQHEESDTLYKIPWLGDIPYLGALFRHKAHSESDYELVVLIKPTVVLTPSRANVATRNFVMENVQDGRNVREALDKTRAQRRANAEARLAEEDASATNTIVNAGVDLEWMPRFGGGGKDAE
ncbi:MAG: type II secretion system protein GspD [Kiritimatiellae bacterium]|nr:type II secretion system protein GspD [Kiritimatiellia bacterium]